MIRRLLVLEREFETQSVDPMFLEPECGLAWYNAGRKSLELVLGVQSPYEAATAIAFLLGEAHDPFKPSAINAQFAYVGGGFGGRDHTPFPLYVALAAMFFPGHPVRLAHNRYQQFQGGIKRHAFKMRTSIGVDRASGKMLAFAADHVLDGGGLANYSASVAHVGATAALGIYEVPKVDVTAVALHSRGVTAGSMRGFGTLQTMTALEVLVDEIAASLPLDPIEFRRRNALKTGGRTMTGNPYTVSIRTPEILDKLENHPIWRERADEKARGKPGIVVGTGVACATKDYGTGADCSLGAVEIDPLGRITIHSDAVEMGNGVGTALANRVAAHLGGMADEVTVAQVDGYGALELVTSGDPYTISQSTQDAEQRDPRWVSAISSATTASIGAHVGTQAAAEAARIVFRFGLWPAALDLWGIAPSDPRAQAVGGRATGRRGNSSCRGWRRCPWRRSRPARIGATTSPARWRTPFLGGRGHERPLWFPNNNGRLTSTRWQCAREAVVTCASTAPLSIFRPLITTGSERPTPRCAAPSSASKSSARPARCASQRLTACWNAARLLVPEVVVGQAQGGFAMGVGYALLESLPPFETGPGNGQWNLGNYVIARGSDLPLHDLEIEILPPLDANEAPKGMAEVVMIPVVAALLNAIFDATGHRFQSLPVTRRNVEGSACVTTLALTINGRAHGPMEVRDELTMNDFLREFLGMTGTKFGCGAAQCLSCAIIVDNPDGTSVTSPTCIVPAGSFNGKAIRTVEGHAKDGDLIGTAKELHRAFRLPMRILHPGVPE